MRWFPIIVLYLILVGCSTHQMQKDEVVYLRLPQQHVFLLPNDHRELKGLRGYAITDLDLSAIGAYWYKGKLIISDPYALGHEYWHQLNKANPDLIWNPDEL